MRNNRLWTSILVLVAPIACFLMGCSSEAPQRVINPAYNNRLINAADRGDVAKVKAMLDKGADVDARDKEDFTPLMRAAAGGHIEVIMQLCKRGADVDAETPDGSTALTFAVINGQLETIQLLIKKGADVNAKNNEGVTPLMFGANQVTDDNRDLVLRDLDVGKKELDIKKIKARKVWAELHGSEITHLLIEKGADVNARDKYDQTALMLCANAGHLYSVKLLIDRGADINARSCSNLTALGYTVFSSHNIITDNTLKIIELLIDSGADVNERYDKGSSPLLKASITGDPRIIQLLINRGADINAQTHEGLTPLHWAAWKGNVGLVQLLVEKGARINARANDGTVLDSARQNWGEDSDVVRYLRSRGAR